MGYRTVTTHILGIFFLFTFGSAFSIIHAQDQTVEGIVTTADDGEPLPGVSILIEGTDMGTTTNIDGYYQITLPEPHNVLVFSYIGFESQEIEVDGRTEIDVSMEASVVSFGDEIVVVGYGVMRRSDMTGAVSSVQAEEIVRVPTHSLQDALQGRISGVNITPVSGRPGSQPEVRVRGVGTLNNADPLYVVDGMLLDDISFLDTRDVESVEVLKDASATAIYGSRGANGVVLITTKSGQAGVPQVQITTSAGIQQLHNRIGLTNAREYAILSNESAANEGRPPVFSNPEQFGEGTDWQNQVFEDAAPMQSYQIGISGGGDQNTYNVSANYFRQSGIVPGSDFQRVTLRANNEYFPVQNFSFGHNISFSYRDWEEEPGPIIQQILQADPTIPVYNEEGGFMDGTVNGGAANPAATIYYNNNEQSGFRATGNVFAELQLLEHFHFRSSFGLDWNREEGRSFTPEFFVSPIQQVSQSTLNIGDTKQNNWLSETTLTYLRGIGDHSLNLLGGVTFQEFTEETLGGTRINFPGYDREFWYLSAGEEDGMTNTNTAFSWGMISYLARANYVFRDRYLLTATFRRDGSSRFAERHRWGNFPSFAAGWVISNESFMDGLPDLNFLKLRASWGVIGNDKIDVGAAVPTVSSNINAVFGEDESIHPGATVTELANPDLRWEETEQVDIGLEIGLFDDRLSAEVDWYRRETKDILVRVPIPGHVGVQTPPIVNAADVLNRGFDFTLNWRASAQDFNYSIGLTGSTVHNEVLSLGELEEEILGGNVRNFGFTTRTVPGQPIGSFYGWKVDGVFQNQGEIDNAATRGVEQPGDLRLVDLNGDGVINEDDQTFLGSPIPDFTFGLNFSAGYRQFDLALDFDGQYGGQVLYGRAGIRGFNLLNYERFYLGRWTGEGTSGTQPRITEEGHNYQTDQYLYDASFFRLRNIQIGYSLPASVTNRLNLQRVRVYLNGTNVFTINDYPGYTTQIGGGSVIATGIDTGTYPIVSSYTLGLEISF